MSWDNPELSVVIPIWGKRRARRRGAPQQGGLTGGLLLQRFEFQFQNLCELFENLKELS